jgi:probable lipoprotein NlpC
MHNYRIVVAALFIFATLLSGCSNYRSAPNIPDNQQYLDLSNQDRVKEILYSQYSEWRSVKYKGGGLSKKGVDCSGFVYLTFDARFSIKLPRSTDEQIKAGPQIPKSKLSPGDLVFFKTGKLQRHVGIYIEDRKFLHASTEKGVMISSLDDQYWARAYWKSVRVNTKNLPITLR